jgi:hypothetical protein
LFVPLIPAGVNRIAIIPEPRMLLDPTHRPAPQLARLVRALAVHDVRWVMCGSYVLALHGADLVPNDLDVVPALDAANLARLARCLDALGAVPARVEAEGWPMSTLEACRAWRSDPPTRENLDQLFVTRHGMLDVVIEFVVVEPGADPYRSLLAGASSMTVGGTAFCVCDPRRVLQALPARTRRKDQQRQAAYAAMRLKFPMPPSVR